MEHTEDILALLNQIPSPAFLVQDGTIVTCNEAAVKRQVMPGSKINDIIEIGQAEYNAYCDGCLYLTLRICGISTSASVTRSGKQHLFVLEQDEDQAELQSMALAAKALRSPLANVMTVADQLFPMTDGADSKEVQEQMARINRGLYQMMRIVCNMSDAYRYSQETSMFAEIRDVGALLREQFEESAPLIAHTGVTLRFTGPHEPIYSLIDAEKLERAVGNILSNAVKFSSSGSVIDASLTRNGNRLYLTVQDNGEGVPQHLRGSIYQHYLRQPGIEDSRFGIGLGMVLIRRTAAAHGGTVLIELTETNGLRLTMTMKVIQHADTTMRSPVIYVDYAGERGRHLLELADCLPAELYLPENIN